MLSLGRFPWGGRDPVRRDCKLQAFKDRSDAKIPQRFFAEQLSDGTFRHLTAPRRHKRPAPQREERVRRMNEQRIDRLLVFPDQNANRNASCISRGWFI